MPSNSPATPDIICIGSVLWDIIGRSRTGMVRGADVPGRITRLPGGVAMNVAMTLRKLGMTPTLLTALGTDPAGEELIATCQRLGIQTEHVHRSANLPTDRYLAIEDSNGLIAAVADAHSLEAAGDNVMLPLTDGRLGGIARPWPGLIALDGNLTESLLADIAVSPVLAAADLRVAPASAGKVGRVRPLLANPRVTLYLNREEAGLLCRTPFNDVHTAAHELLMLGVRRVLVTDGERLCADGKAGEGVITDRPRSVIAKRVTGAGDTFMATHLAAEHRGASRAEALAAAHRAAADYVAGEIGS